MSQHKTKFILIAAMADNRVIGKDWKLPWNNSEDLQIFKRLTTGGTIVMGRKTYDSIGRPLPNRQHIVLSSHSRDIPGVEVFDWLDSLLEYTNEKWMDKVFIIGWQKIYEEFLKNNLIDEVFLSKIPWNFEGNAFLVPFEKDFIEGAREQFETFEFIVYHKIEK